MSELAVIDSNVLVALVDHRDVHSLEAEHLLEKMIEKSLDYVIPDCVVNETFSVVGRRLNAKSGREEIKPVFNKIRSFLKPEKIFWTYLSIQELLSGTIILLEEYDGVFNFHDALLALVMKKESLKFILSFDKHFDLFPWITRIHKPDQLDSI